MGYAGRSKYDEPGKAAAYKARSARRDEEEWRLVARMLDTLPTQPASAWDLPCGTGRIAEQLLARGIPTRCGDLSPAMRAEAEARLVGQVGHQGVVAFDLENPGHALIPPAELVVCLRFLHHLPDRVHRQRVLGTLRRICRGHVLLSFHHPLSFHNLERGARYVFTGKRGDRFTLTCGALRDEAAEAGLEVVRFRALSAYRREFWLALLRPADMVEQGSVEQESVEQESEVAVQPAG